MSRETQLIVSLTLALGVMDAFRSHLPPLWELRDMPGTDSDPTLRATELQMTGLAILAGVVLSAVTRSGWPVAAAAGASVASLASYEWGLRGA